jgi:hypothetical protein
MSIGGKILLSAHESVGKINMSMGLTFIRIHFPEIVFAWKEGFNLLEPLLIRDQVDILQSVEVGLHFSKLITILII